jgi:hypothetical protein
VTKQLKQLFGSHSCLEMHVSDLMGLCGTVGTVRTLSVMADNSSTNRTLTRFYLNMLCLATAKPAEHTPLLLLMMLMLLLLLLLHEKEVLPGMFF